MNSITQLLAVVDAYAQATGRSEARVSALFFGAGHRVKRIRAGGDIGTRQVTMILKEFSVRWPEGAEWPADVPRPVATEPAEDAA
jgi:hypothetical protein